MRTPNYDMSVFKKRREQLAELCKNQYPGAAFVLPSHPEQVRNNDVHHDFRQDSSFFYITGFEEPETVCVFRPGMNPEYVLFVRPKDMLRETWDGFRYGPALTQKYFGTDKIYTLDQMDQELPKLLAEAECVFYRLYHDHEFDQKFQKYLQAVRVAQGRSGRGLLSVHDSSTLIGELRLIKGEQEHAWLAEACEISALGHVEAMKMARPGINERELQAIIEFEFKKRGSPRNGYNNIIAGGANACTLHYVFNDQTIKDGDLVLIDAGAEKNYYTGDITRTFPVNGKFTKTQKIFYEKVLNVQKEVLKMIRPGVLFSKLQDTTIEMLTESMLELSLLKGSVKDNIDSLAYKKYYPHGVSHWLGLDVHDAGLYKIKGESRALVKGMCFTVEPGLYVPVDDISAPSELRGLGVRIEDNIFVTDLSYDNMTIKAPKEVEEIEALMN